MIASGVERATVRSFVAVVAAVGVTVAVSGDPLFVPAAEGLGQQATRQSTVGLLTGPPEHLRSIVAGGGATAEIRFTPMANNADGEPYGHGGAYSELNIDEQTLTVWSGGFRSFWNVHATNWDPDLNGSPKVRITSGKLDAMKFLGENAFPANPDCDITGADQSCTADSDCVAAFNAGGWPHCEDSGKCEYGWVTQRLDPRADGTDWIYTWYAPMARWVLTWPDGPLLISDGDAYARADDGGGAIYYLGSIAFDVPSCATGTYVLDWIPEETFLAEETLVLIPLARIVPGVLTIGTPAPRAPVPDPLGSHVDKNRYISMVIPDSEVETAIRVRLTSLHHPAAPEVVQDFGDWEGNYRWVNSYKTCQGGSEPADVWDVEFLDTVCDDQAGCDARGRGGTCLPQTVCRDSANFSTTFRCARLGCDPEYYLWAEDLGGETLHVTGAAVVPSSEYRVAQLAANCAGSEGTCTAVSNELSIATCQFGDVDPLTEGLGVLDIARVVDHVKGKPYPTTWPPAPGTALFKPRVHLRPNVPDALGENVGVLDIATAVDAVKGNAYWHFGQFGPCTDACPGEVVCP